MEWLNYHHLFYFWTVARAGSIAKASQELRLAQPTISNQLKTLENNLGVKLLERQGRRLPTIGSHVDLNPTVADLAGLAPADSWHGRSMFAPGRPPRAYFYAANDDYLLGVREDGFKYVFNVTTGREELYDLARDPDERHNVADQHPVKCQQLRRRVAAWRAHEAEHLAELRERMPPKPDRPQAEAAAPPPAGGPPAPAMKPVAATAGTKAP